MKGRTQVTLPPDIESYLTKDEKVIKTGKSREWEIYITNKRLIFRKGGIFGKEIVEASYRHISSIEYKRQTPWGDIIGGVVLIILGFFVDDILGLFIPIPRYTRLNYELLLIVLFVILGIISIVYGLVKIHAKYTIHVVGRQPLTVSGRGMEEIIRIIREYREKVQL